MSIYKKKFIHVVLIMSGWCGLSVSAAERPNVVIVFNDDQGYQDLGCYGSPDIETPYVDRLAEEGMLFTDFYVASSVCSASRASLLTGYYPQKIGVNGVYWPNRPHGLDPKHTTLAEMLKSVGYATAAVGKWHLGDDPEYLPTNQGFDSYYGIPYSNDMYPDRDMKYAEDCVFREGMSPEVLDAVFEEVLENKAGLPTKHWQYGQPKKLKNKVPLMRDEECVEFPADQSTITRRFADEGIRFISESVEAEKPFFLYLANSMPHIPLFASPEFEGKSANGPYGDTIEEIDSNTGRIMNHLEALGVAENTIFIFTSDNGPWLVMGKNGGSALPLFEGKMSAFEGGFRVPFVIRWPSMIRKGAVCSEIASAIDLFPTIARIVGAEQASRGVDGKDIFDLWTREGAKSPHDYFFYVYGGKAVRWCDWKYHQKEVFKVKATARDTGGPTLYNLKEDIGETNNVIEQYPEIADRLARALDTHLESISQLR